MRAMSLPRSDDEAGFRALDRQCADPKSTVSKRIVRQLSVAPLAYKTSFMYSTTLMGLGKLVRCALEAGMSADMTTKVASGSAPFLAVAAARGTTPALKALLAGGANIELTDKSGSTALAIAASYGNLPCVQLLLDSGADANTQDWLGLTPLMLAVMDNYVDCARALLPVSDLSKTNIAGRTVFHVAAMNASEACFELLLPMMSDVNMRTVPGVDPDGKAVPIFDETALHFACESGQLHICKALLGRGADRLARDSGQSTPLHIAAHGCHLSCVIMLVGRPGKVRMTSAEVDASTEKGWTPLHVAAQHGSDQICGVLLGAGSQLDAKTSGGATLFMVAQQCHPTNAALLSLLSGTRPLQPVDLVCDHCGKTAEQASVKSLKDCGKCYAARYCGKKCQLAAWPAHKAVCKRHVKERQEATRATEVDPPASTS